MTDTEYRPLTQDATAAAIGGVKVPRALEDALLASVEASEPPSVSRIVYLLWSNKHQAWWRPDARGYTNDQAEAGRYSEAEATRYVVQSAHSGLLSRVTCMVAAPDNWGVTP